MANSRRHPWVIPASLADANLTGVEFTFTRAAFADEVVDPSGPNAARTDGGDLRIFDSFGVEFAIDVIAFEHDSATGAGDAIIEVRASIPAVSATTGATGEFQYGDAALTAVAVTDPLGRNAVHAALDAFWRFDNTSSIVDRTGNGHDLALFNSPTLETGPLGPAVRFNGSNQYAQNVDGAVFNTAAAYSLGLWFAPNWAASEIYGRVVELGGHNTARGGVTVQQYSNAGLYQTVVWNTGNGQANTTITGTGDEHVIIATNTVGPENTSYTNGVLELNDTAFTRANLAASIVFGGKNENGTLANANFAITASYLRNDIVSLARAAAEFRNEDDPASYVTPGTPEAIGGEVAIAIDDVAHGHTATVAGIAQTHVVVVADVAHGHAVDPVGLGQGHIVAAADVSHGHAAEGVGIAQGHTVDVADGAHAQGVDPVGITQTHVLAVASSLHGHSVDPVGVAQTHVLVIADAAHGHSADQAIITLAGGVQPSDVAHGHVADVVGIKQTHVVAVGSASHAQSADSVDLAGHHQLVIAGCGHNHDAASVDLAQQYFLAGADAGHDQAADTVIVIQHHIVPVVNIAHAHLAAEVVVFATLPDAPPAPPSRTLEIHAPANVLSVGDPARTLNVRI